MPGHDQGFEVVPGQLQLRFLCPHLIMMEIRFGDGDGDGDGGWEMEMEP